MKQAAINYAKALYGSQIPEETVMQSRQICRDCPQLLTVLMSPLVSYEEKARVVSKVFPDRMQNFMKIVCYYDKTRYLMDIFEQYAVLSREAQSIIAAKLYYVMPPSEKYLNQIKEFVLKKYEGKQVELELESCPELLGGFVLQVGNIQYDCSAKGAIHRLTQKLVRR